MVILYGLRRIKNMKHNINIRKTKDKTNINRYSDIRQQISKSQLDKKKKIDSTSSEVDKVSTTRPLNVQVSK